MNRLLLFAIFLLYVLPVEAQIVLSTELNDRLSRTGIDLNLPVESDYRSVRIEENTFFDIHLQLRSRQERMDMLFQFLPYSELKSDHPHLPANTMAMHLASNEPDAIIAGHSFSVSDLTEQFNADWAMLYTFPPKRAFSVRTTCRLLALYREGVGMAFVAFLFDDPPITLDARLYALRFRSELPDLR